MIARRPFSDRYVFAKVMQDNPDLCKELIERILGIKVRGIKSLQVEAEASAVLRRSVRFDVFLQSDEAAFEVEMQTYEQRDLAKRMRFYRSQIDRLMLGKGAGYDELKPVYIIFICTQDPFGAGLPVYTFKRTCTEDDSVSFYDEATDMVLCSSGDLSKTSPGIASLLQFIKTGTANIGDALTGELGLAVDRAYRDEEWVNDMSWLDWDLEDARRAAAQKGLDEGRAEGLAEGRKEGKAEGLAAGFLRQKRLIGAMEAAGCDDAAILEALKNDDIDALCRQYGIE